MIYRQVADGYYDKKNSTLHKFFKEKMGHDCKIMENTSRFVLTNVKVEDWDKCIELFIDPFLL